MKAMPADTTIDAAVKQFEVLRRLDINARAKMTFELSNNLRSIVEAGVRLRHPDFDEQQVRQEVLLLMIGETLFRQICPDARIKL